MRGSDWVHPASLTGPEHVNACFSGCRPGPIRIMFDEGNAVLQRGRQRGFEYRLYSRFVPDYELELGEFLS
jgi:hypothetical protein